MAVFNRRQNSNVPEDLEAYTAGRRDWKAWVRAAVAIAILVVLVAGVIWAGVKVYQNVTDDETTNQPIDETTKEDKNTNPSDSNKKSDTTKDTSTQSAPNTGSSTTDTTPKPAAIPKTGDDAVTPQPATLPSTGG